MARIRLHKDSLNPFKSEIVITGGNLLEVLKSEAPWADVVMRNGEQIDISDADIELSEFDEIDVFAVPQGIETAIIAVIAVVAAAVAIALMPKPKLPNNAGETKSSPNNQLSAASNEFRPRQALPHIYGKVKSYPDFIQRSFYTYSVNRRQFTELFCIGVGEYDVSEVKDGTTLFDDLELSDFTVYGPNDTVPSDVLLDVRGAEGSVDLPLPAANDQSRQATIQQGRFLGGDTVNLGLTAGDIIADLSLTAGDSIELDVTYEDSGTQFSWNQIYTITSVGSASIVVSPANLPFTDPGSVNGLIIKDAGTNIGQWFVLDGDAIEEVRFQLTMPQGIRKGDGTTATVGFTMQVEEVDATGTPTGVNQFSAGGNFTGNTLNPQYQTRVFESLPASRYRARVYRTSNSLGNNAADLLKCERIESVTPYTENFGDVTVLLAKRATSPQQGRSGSTKINAVVDRKIEIFDPNTGTFGARAATRNLADIVMHFLVYEAGEPIANIDYESLYDAVPAGELGYFDFTFDDKDVSVGEALQTMLNVARCYYYMVGNRYAFERDESKSVRSALFNRRNTLPERSEQVFTMHRDQDYDSVEVRYVDPVDNSDAYVRRRINPTTGAIENGLGQRVNEMTLAGCRNTNQATNRAELEIRKIKYLWLKVKDKVTAEGLTVGLGQRVGWCDINDSDVQDGEILEALSGDTFITSEKVTLDVGTTYYGYIVQPDGTTSPVFEVSAVAGNDYAFQASQVVSALVADGYEVQQGSLYVIAPLDSLNARDFTVVRRGKPDENYNVDIELINYDERVYEMD